MNVRRIVRGGSGAALAVLLLTMSDGPALTPADIADAAMRGDSAAVRALLARKADVNAPQGDGATALHWAVYRGDKELVRVLVRAGANVKAANREGATPLWLASIGGDADIVSALVEAGADPNEKLPLGRSPLMVASRTGKIEAMKVLIDRGADVNAKDTLRGTTPIMWAADEGHAAAIKLLIDRGADINAKSSPAERGRGPALGKSGDPRRAVAALGAAVAAGQPIPGLGQLGGLNGSPRSTTGRGGARGGGAEGAGAAGVDQNDDAAVQAFGGRGPAPKDGGALTPLVFATRANDLESVKVLLAAGADINAKDGTRGLTPLHEAARWGWNDVVQFLVDHGANLQAKDNRGMTPVDSALGKAGGNSRGGQRIDVHEDTAALLRKLGGVSGSPAVKP